MNLIMLMIGEIQWKWDNYNMEKVIRDGKVAVLYSPGYGAGWTT